jgi:hypothetical protein
MMLFAGIAKNTETCGQMEAIVRAVERISWVVSVTVLSFQAQAFLLLAITGVLLLH